MRYSVPGLRREHHGFRGVPSDLIGRHCVLCFVGFSWSSSTELPFARLCFSMCWCSGLSVVIVGLCAAAAADSVLIVWPPVPVSLTPGPHRTRQRCSGPVGDRPSASRPVSSRQNRLQRRLVPLEAILTTELAGTRSDGRTQGRSSADGCGEDRASVGPGVPPSPDVTSLLSSGPLRFSRVACMPVFDFCSVGFAAVTGRPVPAPS